MTTQPMPLEETISHLWDESGWLYGDSVFATDEASRKLIEHKQLILRSALHHLEAGKVELATLRPKTDNRGVLSVAEADETYREQCWKMMYSTTFEGLEQARRDIKRLATAVMLSSPAKYLAWANAGGVNECAHGYSEGIPCPKCDLAFAKSFLPSTPTEEPQG